MKHWHSIKSLTRLKSPTKCSNYNVSNDKKDFKQWIDVVKAFMYNGDANTAQRGWKENMRGN